MGGAFGKITDDKISVLNKIEMKNLSIEVDELDLLSEIYITKDRKTVFTRKGSRLYSYIEYMSSYNTNLGKYIEETPLLPSDIKNLINLIKGIDGEEEEKNDESEEEYEDESETSDKDSSTFESENESKYSTRDDQSQGKDKVPFYNYEMGSETIHHRFNGQSMMNGRSYIEEVSVSIDLISNGKMISSGGSFVKILNKNLVKSYLYLDSVYKSVVFTRRGELLNNNDQFSKWCLLNNQVIDNFVTDKTEADKEIVKLLEICILKFREDEKLIDSLYEKNNEETFINIDNFVETTKRIYDNTNVKLLELMIPALKKIKNLTEREKSLFESFNKSLLNDHFTLKK